MRLCNALIQYIVFISLSLICSHCHGHEHHNHADPVASKFAESAVTVDPLSKPRETANVPDNHDDGHQHDTIDARLRAKHDLRQSVHLHSEDDQHENEDDYINQLNSALENDYKTEHHFQYVPPPIADTVNHTTVQNRTEEDSQIPIHTQNETVSSTSASTEIPPEQEQSTNERLPATETPPAEEKYRSKVVTQETVSPVQTQNNQQQNLVKEDILFIHKETLTPTKSEAQEEKLAVDDPSSPSDQQPSVVNTTVNETVQNQTSSDRKPLQTDQTEQAAFESAQNTSSSDSKLTQPKVASDTLQKTDPIDAKSNEQENEVEVTSATPTTNLNSEQLKATGTKKDQEQPFIEPTVVNRSADDDVQSLEATDAVTSSPILIKTEQQQPQTVDTTKPTETPPTDAKSDNVSSSVTESTPTVTQTQITPSRILRSATTRMQHRAQLRQRQLREQELEPEKLDNSTVETPVPTSTLPTAQQPVEENLNHSVASDERESSAEVPTTLQPEEPTVETPQTPTLEPEEFTEESTPKPLADSNEPTVELPQASTSQSEEVTLESTQTPLVQVQEPFVETAQKATTDVDLTNETDTSSNDPDAKTVDPIDLPRQVHIHDPRKVQNELKQEMEKTDNSSLDQQLENNTTVDSFLVNDHTRHLPRTLEKEETVSTTDPTPLTLTNTVQTIETTPETNLHTHSPDSKAEETTNPLSYKTNISDQLLSTKNRQVCWRLVKPLDSSVQLIENQTLRFATLLPEFLQTTLFGRLDDRETIMNTIWFSSISTLCFLFSLIFLSCGAKRLKQTKHEKETRARCQQLQQYNNQLELERATFERENQKLFDEIEELKNQPVRDSDEEIFQLRENYERLHAEWKNLRAEYDNLQRDNDYKQSLMQKHNLDIQKQVESVAYLNDEILRQKQELEKERETIARLQSNDLSLERFEQLQQIIHELRSEITQLKQDKFKQTDELQQLQERANQLEIDNNELTLKMKQLKELLEQRDQTITRFKQKVNNNNNEEEDEEEENEDDDDQQTREIDAESDQQQRELLSTIDSDVQKANQHMKNLHSEIEEKTRRLKELDTLLNHEKDRCRELETKLKVVLELRERDAHLHIRQLGQTDAELRKARTDTERVRILQQQLELKQQQLDDVQKVLASEQSKFSEDCSKLQHETHEKWMEVKRLTRELDGSKKECEGLRRQITKYAQNDRSSQEKMMHKPIAQHLNNTGRLSSEPETNGSSPPTLPYQQGDKPIDNERNDSGAASPSDMLRNRPPIFGHPRPPFFPPPFMPPLANPFLMAPRFAMPPGGPHGMISPISHLMTNGSAAGSDSNSFEMVDSTNITPNSTSYDAQINGSALSPTPDDQQQPTTAKPKKAKKSLKKKTKTSATTTVPDTKEDV